MRDAVAYHGPERIAAIIAEPVIGAGGVFPPVDGYLQGLRDLCDESGALLIFDEVITGFGRLGSWFGSHHFGVQPDLMTFAKAVTSGYLPLGGVVVGPRLREWLEADDEYLFAHGDTYSGHPSCCAAGIANLEILSARTCPSEPRPRAAAARRPRRASRSGRRRRGPRRGTDAGGRPRASLAAGAVIEALLARGVIGRALPTPTRSRSRRR